MANVLIFSDLHVHQWSYGADYAFGRNSRLEAQEKFLFDIQMYVRDNSIDHVVFGGDLFHTHGKVDLEVLHVAIEGLRGIKRAVKHDCYALIGNHDIKHREGDHYIHSLYNAVNWVPTPIHTWLSSGNLGFISYQHDNEEFLRQFYEICSHNSPEFIFTHQGVKNVGVGSGFEIPDEVLSPDLIPSTKSVFTGHYHRHQVVAPNLTVIGSPMQHTWGDKGEDRGFIVLDTNTGKWKFRPYEAAPRFKEITADDTTTDVNNCFVRVIDIVGDKENKRKQLFSAGAKAVEFRAVTKQEFLQIGLNVDKTDQIETVIATYEQSKKADESTVEVGKAIRSGTYAAPPGPNS